MMRASLNGVAASVARAALAVTALAASAGSAIAEVPVSGDPALYWNQVLSKGLAGSPTVTTRSYAMVSAGIFDAVNATVGKPNYAFVPGISASGGDTRAATSVAAHTLLVVLNPGKAAEYDAALAASLALVPDGAAKTAGIATGAAVAAATMAYRANDGSFDPSTYAPSGLPGHWAPTPPGNAPAAVPQWGDSDPWLLVSQDQFRAPPPPNIGTAEYAMAYNEVLAIGAVNSATRTADQSASAKFWESASGAAPWIQAGLGVAEGGGLSTVENARLFAMLSVSLADTAIALWDTKYEYDYWRPVTAIRGGDLDGNPDTIADPNWTPFITTPPHPSYISGHSGVAGAASTILANFLGDNHAFCLSSGGMDRCWNSYSEASLDAANSRLWGGIHWRFDNEQGLLLGQEIAAYALSTRAFDAVPEPATWGLMILGFASVGAVLRRRARGLRAGAA